MICSIFMALRAIYFMSIILGDPVDYRVDGRVVKQ